MDGHNERAVGEKLHARICLPMMYVNPSLSNGRIIIVFVCLFEEINVHIAEQLLHDAIVVLYR